MIECELIDGKFDGAVLGLPDKLNVIYIQEEHPVGFKVFWNYSYIPAGVEIEIYTCNLIIGRFYHKSTETTL